MAGVGGVGSGTEVREDEVREDEVTRVKDTMVRLVG